MRVQSPQRRYLYWLGVLMLLAMLVSVPLLVAANHYQQGLVAQCAEHFEEDKPALAGYHWSWWWLPGWECEFERDGLQRHLW